MNKQVWEMVWSLPEPVEITAQIFQRHLSLERIIRPWSVTLSNPEEYIFPKLASIKTQNFKIFSKHWIRNIFKHFHVTIICREGNIGSLKMASIIKLFWETHYLHMLNRIIRYFRWLKSRIIAYSWNLHAFSLHLLLLPCCFGACCVALRPAFSPGL